jgi:hypothetical protein
MLDSLLLHAALTLMLGAVGIAALGVALDGLLLPWR